MADYKIAPESIGIISLGAMRKSLEAEADYAAGSKHTAAPTSVNTLVGSPATYQSNVDTFTWSTTNPKGFNEMYGETWSDGSGGGGSTVTLSYNFENITGASSFTVSIVQGGSTLYSGGAATGTVSCNTGTISVNASATHLGDPYILKSYYRVPNSGGYTTLNLDSSGPGGGSTSISGNFTIGSSQTTAGVYIEVV